MSKAKSSQNNREIEKNKEVLGPYEKWNFGDGNDYTFPPIRRDREFLTAMASVANPISLEKLNGERIQSGTFFSWFPTLWQPEIDLEVNFLPIVITEPPKKGIEKGKYDVANSFFYSVNNAFLKGLRSLLGEGCDGLEIQKFRVAFPISERAMNSDASSPPAEPVEYSSDDTTSDEKFWYPDKPIKKWVEEQSDAENPKHLTVHAVIDDGVPFAHEIYRAEDGKRSRVEFCWMQSVTKDGENKNPTVTFGREYMRPEIEELISEHNDEDYLYHVSGALDDQGEFGSILEQHGTHGAHVMDQACGYSKDLGDKIREEIRIIAVQLPNEMTLDTSGFAKDAYILSAFHYIFNRADIIAKEYGVENLRLVINLSFGFTAGRLDGKTDLEYAIDQLVEHRRDTMCSPTALVMPAGNSFLSRLHSQISEDDFKNENSFSLDWNVQPNDRTSSYMEIWFPEGFNPAGYQLTATSPNLDISTTICIDQIEIDRSAGSDFLKSVSIAQDENPSIGFVSVDRHQIKIRDEVCGERWRMMVILAPTEAEDQNVESAPSGLWKVELTRSQNARCLGNGVINFRVQRDENFSSEFSGARQSYIEDEENILFDKFGQVNEFDSKDSHVSRFGTINGLATGCYSLVVGGFRPTGERDWKINAGEPSSFSSAGVLDEDASCPPEPNVDCSAMADRSTVLPGTIAAGTRSGSFSQLQGTSSAAPFVSCAIAEAFTLASDNKVKAAKDSNYLDLITKDTSGLDTRAVDVDAVYIDSEPNIKLTMKTRLGDYMIIPKQDARN